MIWILLVLSAVNIPTMALESLIFAYAGLGISVAFWKPSTTLSFINFALHLGNTHEPPYIQFFHKKIF